MSEKLLMNDHGIDDDNVTRRATKLLAFKIATSIYEQIDSEIMFCVQEGELTHNIEEDAKNMIRKQVVRSFILNYKEDDVLL